jgi:hypothetical protein
MQRFFYEPYSWSVSFRQLFLTDIEVTQRNEKSRERSENIKGMCNSIVSYCCLPIDQIKGMCNSIGSWCCLPCSCECCVENFVVLCCVSIANSPTICIICAALAASEDPVVVKNTHWASTEYSIDLLPSGYGEEFQVCDGRFVYYGLYGYVIDDGDGADLVYTQYPESGHNSDCASVGDGILDTLIVASTFSFIACTLVASALLGVGIGIGVFIISNLLIQIAGLIVFLCCLIAFATFNEQCILSAPSGVRKYEDYCVIDSSTDTYLHYSGAGNTVFGPGMALLLTLWLTPILIAIGYEIYKNKK